MAKDDRTEKPTPKRKREARKKGQVARSTELPQGVGLAAAILLLPMTLPRISESLSTDWRYALNQVASSDPDVALTLFGRFFSHAAVALAPLVAGVGLAGVVAQVAMVGGRPNAHQLKPKWERVNPKAGIKRLVSGQAVWELVKNLVKLGLLGVVAYGGWRTGMDRLLASPGSADRSLAIVGQTARSLLTRVAILALLIGVADAVHSKRKHLKSIRMTKHEVKEEHKQGEGNPYVKGAIKQKMRQMSRSRMIAEVSRASVVVTNPTHFAVALAYAPGSPAPIVVAKGADEVAAKIRQEARKWGIPIRENKPLARALFRAADVGEQIPVALYQAVAELLAAIWRTKRAAVPA